MTFPLRPSVLVAGALAGVVLGAFVPVRGVLVGTASAADADLAALRTALDRAFVAAEADHARARAKDFADHLGRFPGALRDALRDEKSKDPARVLGRIPEDVRPLSAVTLRVVIARMLVAGPREPAPRDDAEGERACRDRFLAEVSDVFSAERFEDCWDRAFQDLPEVVAWRAAHASKTPRDPAVAPESPPPPGPRPADPEASPPRTPETVPVEPAPPRAAPAGPDLPPPHAADPAANLVPLDRSRGWVGPWTGWVQEIPEKDNRRQKRPAKAVWIDRYEVTCLEYLRFLREEEPARRRALLPGGWTIDERDEPAFPEGRERTPVTDVTFSQAQAYAASLGKRLPTEDEWDRAAGGGDREGRAYPWGSEAGERRWAFAGGGATGPVPVDAHADDRTPEGVLGLAGNVAEMVATLPDRHDLPAKVTLGLEIVVRGGSYRTSREGDCGTTFRWVLRAGESAPHVGFRCVTDEAEYRRRFR